MDLHTFLMTIIASMALLTGLGFVFKLLLDPVKKDMARLEGRMVKLESRMDNLEAGQAEILKQLSRLNQKA